MGTAYLQVQCSCGYRSGRMGAEAEMPEHCPSCGSVEMVMAICDVSSRAEVMAKHWRTVNDEVKAKGLTFPSAFGKHRTTGKVHLLVGKHKTTGKAYTACHNLFAEDALIFLDPADPETQTATYCPTCYKRTQLL